jgi:site-specific recombinase XerD
MPSTTFIRRKGTTEGGPDRPITELVESYLGWLEQRDKSPRTIKTYRYVLEAYATFFEGRQVSTLSLDDVEAWVRRPRRGPVKNTTLRKDAIIVRCFHEWLIERGVHTHPLRTLKFGKSVRTMPKPVDDDVWRRVWEDDRLDDLDRMWLGLGYFAGLRRFEIVTLTPSDCDLGPKELVFDRKGGFAAAVEYGACFNWIEAELPHLTGGVDWPTIFAQHVHQRRLLGANYVWPDSTAGDEYDCNRLNKRSSKVMRSLGVPDAALTPHRLRHSCATNLLRCGLPIEYVQRTLAHSSVDITQGYLQVSGALARAYHSNPERAGGP